MSNKLNSMFEEDAFAKPSEDDIRLGELGRLANAQIDLTRRIEELNKELEKANDALRLISEAQIPDLMNQLGGIQKIVVRGRTIEIKKWYGASISEVNKPHAFKWLAEHDHDSLIKNDVIAKFGKGENDKAKKLVKAISELGYGVEQKMYVHPQTLKAFVKEQIEKGVDFPQDLFGVHTGYVTTIK